MKVTKRSEYLIIVSLYIITLFLGVYTFFNIAFIDKIRYALIVILPALISLSILFDNIKNLKVLFKNKIPLILYVLTIIWLFLTLLFGIDINLSSIKGFIHYSVLLTLILVIFNSKFEKETLSNIKKHLFISFALSMCFGIFQYLTKYNLNTYNNDKYPGIFGRINSTFYIATTFDKYIVLMFPIITYELLNDKDNKYYKILLVLSMLGITFTFSRSGQLIYLVMCFVFFIVTLFKKQFKNSALIVLLVICMILIPGAKYSIQSALDYAYETVRMPKVLRINLLDKLGSEIKEVEAGKCADDDCVGDIEGSNFFRKYYESVGKAFIKEYPVFGVGIGNATYLYENQNAKEYLKDDSVISDEYPYMYPHNCYIQLTEETGLIGIVLLLSFVLSLAFIKLKSSVKENKTIFYVILLMLFGLALANITEGLFYSKQVIYLFAIGYAIYCNSYSNNKINGKKIKESK